MERINKKTIRKILVATINLYGVLSIPDLFKLLDHYFKDYDKNKVTKDILSIFDNEDLGFQIAVFDSLSDDPLIINSFLDDSEIEKIFLLQEGIEMFIPSTLKEFLKYSDGFYVTKEEKPFYNKLKIFLEKHLNGEFFEIRDEKFSRKRYVYYLVSYVRFLFKSRADIDYIIGFLKEEKLTFKTRKDLDKLNDYIYNAFINIKTFRNKGYSFLEIWKIDPSIKIDQKIYIL